MSKFDPLGSLAVSKSTPRRQVLDCRSPSLTRSERFDLRLSRALPKFLGRMNRLLIRLSRGRLGSSKRGIPIGLLTTRGRRSGRATEVPLMYFDDGGRYLVVAANSGRDRPPQWFLNLKADQAATFDPDRSPRAVRARVVEGDERARLWPRLLRHNPLWGAFQSCTDRETAIVSLDPVLDEGPAPSRETQRERGSTG